MRHCLTTNTTHREEKQYSLLWFYMNDKTMLPHTIIWSTPILEQWQETHYLLCDSSLCQRCGFVLQNISPHFSCCSDKHWKIDILESELPELECQRQSQKIRVSLDPMYSPLQMFSLRKQLSTFILLSVIYPKKQGVTLLPNQL